MNVNAPARFEKSTSTANKSRLRRALAAIPVVGTILLASACAAPAPAAPEEEELVTVRIGSAPAAGMIAVWVALENGLFLDHGLDIEMKEFNTGGEVTQAIAAGHLDAGIANLSNSVPLARAGGTMLKATSLTTEPDPSAIYVSERFGVLARADSGVTSSNPKAIKGKKVGLQVGGTPELYFRNYLKSLGLTPDDVDIQNIPVTDLGVALEQSIVDVGVTWDPNILRHRNQMGNAIVLVQEGGSFVSDLGVWVASDELLEKRPEVAKSMLRAIVEANVMLHKDPKIGVEVATRYMSGLSAEEAKYMLAKGNFDPRASVCTREDFKRGQDELIAGGRLEASKAFKFEDLVAVDLLDSVLKEYKDDFASRKLPTKVQDCLGY